MIPLPDSDVLDLKAPLLSDYIDSTWNYGPGSDVVGLYLTRPQVWASYEPVEEYRSHVATEDLLPAGWVAYYRAWRPGTAGRPTWDEYARAIYVRSQDVGHLTVGDFYVRVRLSAEGGPLGDHVHGLLRDPGPAARAPLRV